MTSMLHLARQEQSAQRLASTMSAFNRCGRPWTQKDMATFALWVHSLRRSVNICETKPRVVNRTRRWQRSVPPQRPQRKVTERERLDIYQKSEIGLLVPRPLSVQVWLQQLSGQRWECKFIRIGPVASMETYLDEDANLIRSLLPTGMTVPDDAHDLFILYAVLMRAKGERVSRSDVHDAWCAWKQQRTRSHRAFVPFVELDEATQNADLPYVHAIRAAARVRASVQESTVNTKS